MRIIWAAGLASIAMCGAYAAPAPGDARLQKIAKPWVQRFEQERLLGGYGSSRGAMQMDMLVTAAEYRAIARRHGWGQPPSTIRLGFSKGVSGPAVSEAAQPLVKIFAHSDRALGVTNQALLGGRIILRGGCLYVTARDQPDRLAYFPREFGLTLDPRGHPAIRSRLSGGKIVGAVGDDFNWGGPIGIVKDAPMVAELRAKCGNAPIEHVGMLVTQAEFRKRYGLRKASN